MIAGEAAQAHERHGHGDARLADQLAQLGGRVGGDHATAGVDHRAFRPADRLGDRADLLVEARGGSPL